MVVKRTVTDLNFPEFPEPTLEVCDIPFDIVLVSRQSEPVVVSDISECQ
jgi:hypothetical protein